MTPLFNAPSGTVWGSDHHSSLAHLVLEEAGRHHNISICDVQIDGFILSLQVGGYSRQPCLYCIAQMWAKMVKMYKPEAVQ